MRRGKKSRTYKKEKRFISVFSSRPFFFFSIIVLAGVINICLWKFFEWRWAKDILVSQEAKIKEREEREEQLRKTLEYLKSEKYLIRILKERLNLVNLGERVIYILPEEKKEGEVIEEKSFFEKFVEKLKDFLIK